MADLKILKVFEQDGKQVGYQVQKADGSIIQVDKKTLITSKNGGHSFVNATISDTGVVRVNKDVPREELKAKDKPVKPPKPFGQNVKFPHDKTIYIYENPDNLVKYKQATGEDLFKGFKITKYKFSDYISEEDYWRLMENLGLSYKPFVGLLDEFLSRLDKQNVFNVSDKNTYKTYITNLPFLWDNFSGINDTLNDFEIIVFTFRMSYPKEFPTVREAFYKKAFSYFLKWADETHMFYDTTCAFLGSDWVDDPEPLVAWINMLIYPDNLMFNIFIQGDYKPKNYGRYGTNCYCPTNLYDLVNNCIRVGHKDMHAFLETATANEAKLLIKFYTELFKKVQNIID
jgi:hypothetical protein